VSSTFKLYFLMDSKKINQLATELAPDLSDLTIIGDPTTGISKKITLSQMASLFTGTVEEYANLAAFPLVGVADTIYIALDTNILYRWNTGTSAYVELSPNIVSSLVFNDANGFDGTINLVGSVATLTITTALTTGSVGFIGASGALLQDNANFFWDDTNNRLGLGTNAPTTALDVFGSGIIGRINGTSTNNAYLGFASAGTNKWSVGNVQSDHRFRIFSEANSAELISVLQTGEFGIGIANPTTKFHIDGAASALIANLDANVSVAKSISFRSDNSNRINLEVSGTESGSNAGANFFIRRYSDAGALIDTPLTITRSTGAISLATTLNLSEIQASTSAGITLKSNGGTSVALFGAGGGAGTTLYGGLIGTSASFGGALSVTGNNFFTLNTTNTNARIGEYDAANRIAFTANQTAANAQDDATKPSWGLVFNANSTDTAFIGHKAAGGGSSALTSLMTIAGTGGINIPVSLNNSNTGLDLTNSAGSGYGNAINFYQSTTKYGQILCETSAANTSEIYFKTMVASTVATRLFISNGGNILINKSADNGDKLQVTGNTSLSGNIGVRTGSISNCAILAYSETSTSSKYAMLLYDPSDFALFNVRGDGLIGTGTRTNSPYNLTVTGRDCYIDNTGYLGYLSSVRESKININNIENVDWLLNLNPVSFNKRKKDENQNYTDEFYNELDYGLIAEEAELINDQICFYDETEEGKIIRGVSYTKLITPMLKMIQQQQEQIEELKALIIK
jgi:hypothetical protein